MKQAAGTSRALSGLSALLVLLFCAGGALAQSPAPSGLLKTHLDFLEQEGFKVEVRSAAHATFRREGRTYVVVVDESDPAYFRLELRFRAEAIDADERARRLEAIAAAMIGTKVARAYIDREGLLVFQVAYHQASPGDANRSMGRFFRMIDTAYDHYRRALR